MAGARYRNYFPEQEIHTGFNSKKCKTYFPYLKAKGLFMLNMAEADDYGQNTRNCTKT